MAMKYDSMRTPASAFRRRVAVANCDRAHHLEAAADALLLASLKLRDHVLGDLILA